MTKIALAAGHKNHNSGNPTEIEIVGRVTFALAQELRARGAEVRVITPGDGHGTYPGSLNAVAREVITWAKQGWAADFFVEVHADSLSTRGAFVVYPDWGLDVDVDVRDRFGPAIARGIRDQTGIPVRDTGVMSERQTGVGVSGSRLGIFNETAPLRATLTRILIEVGSYGSRADLEIMRRGDFAVRCAAGIADGLIGAAAQISDEGPQVLGKRSDQIETEEYQWIGALRDHKAHERGLSNDAQLHLFRECVRQGVEPWLILGLLHKETDFGRGGAGAANNWLNVREYSPDRPSFRHTDALGVARTFARYGTPEQGIEMGIEYLASAYGYDHPNMPRTIHLRPLLLRWAPPTDGNDSERFMRSILEDRAFILKRKP